MDSIIKPLSSEHFNNCVDLFIESYNVPPWNNKWTHISATNYLTELLNLPKALVYGLFELDTLLGAIFANERTWWTKNEVYISEFFIYPAKQRLGYGHKLLSEVESHCLSIGINSITLLTDRNIFSKDFYMKNGYKTLENIIFMHKKL
jgi:aminoglycoside 6'-N-acetyltransferase I